MLTPCLRLADHLPGLGDIVAAMAVRTKPTVTDRMRDARDQGRLLFQPRAGVGGFDPMVALLSGLQDGGRADILPITVDSHTRLEKFDIAAKCLEISPKRLNGFPVVAHGYRKLRALDDAMQAPLQIRHGSPDGRRLMAECIAGGVTSFEGGPIGYNLPYCADVPLEQSFAAWAEIDELAGLVTAQGFPVEREFFGSLTAVAVPPSIALACTLIEALCAAQKGVTALSIALPQGGNMIQDIAALRAVVPLARDILPVGCDVFTVLHQFMGVFPADRASADALIATGALTAALGGAQKVICKTYQEAHGVPDLDANVAGLLLSRAAADGKFASLPLDDAAISAEQAMIEREVRELLDPILSRSNPAQAAIDAFRKGWLDIPFPANEAAHGEVFPLRDPSGALRYGSTGRLPFSDATARHNAERLQSTPRTEHAALVRDAILYFANTGQSE